MDDSEILGSVPRIYQDFHPHVPSPYIGASRCVPKTVPGTHHFYCFMGCYGSDGKYFSMLADYSLLQAL